VTEATNRHYIGGRPELDATGRREREYGHKGIAGKLEGDARKSAALHERGSRGPQVAAHHKEGATSAEDHAKQLAETVDSLNEQLDDAQKDITPVERTLKASSRVARRRINYNKPSRWTQATDENNLTEYFTEQFGPDWLNFDAMGEGGGEEPVDPSKAAYPTKVVGVFL
jgi:hypothetical protein